MPPEYVHAIAYALDNQWIIPDNESLDTLEIYGNPGAVQRNQDVMTVTEIRQTYGTGLVW